ncbi:hypothetical protein JCGZ_03509 [Jatropha curcas]|uniref:LOB domain-containing protein n=1 Tax=Jatropha curcas TaxID=180498 RepID=A0A067KYB1_JATCU|nr:hypothetical protein JCGZ_03509 [Jatropha curcas]
MVRRQNDPESSRLTYLILLLMGFISCALAYTVLSLVLNPNVGFTNSGSQSLAFIKESSEGNDGDCCRGIENLELWGPAVKWGSEFKFNSSKECCQAFLLSLPSAAVIGPCSACKILRRPSTDKCYLASYFPPSAEPHNFTVIDSLFRHSNVVELLQVLEN